MQKLKVIYEDNHIIVVEKIPNVPSQSDKTGDIDMLTMVKQYIKEKYNKPGNVYLGLVHRLDRPVGGIMIFAKTSKAASRLSDQVREKVFKKKYLAVVDGKIENKSGTLEDYLYKDERNNISKVVNKDKKNIGVVGTLDMSSTGVVEVWYSIDKDLRGKGYGEKVLAQVTPYLIENIKGLNDIELKIDKNNKASKKVALRNGYILDDEDKELGIDIYHYFGKH